MWNAIVYAEMMGLHIDRTHQIIDSNDVFMNPFFLFVVFIKSSYRLRYYRCKKKFFWEFYDTFCHFVWRKAIPIRITSGDFFFSILDPTQQDITFVCIKNVLNDIKWFFDFLIFGFIQVSWFPMTLFSLSLVLSRNDWIFSRTRNFTVIFFLSSSNILSRRIFTKY